MPLDSAANWDSSAPPPPQAASKTVLHAYATPALNTRFLFKSNKAIPLKNMNSNWSLVVESSIEVSQGKMVPTEN